MTNNLYSFGANLDDEKSLVVKVETGDFKNVIFSINNLKFANEDEGLLSVDYDVKYAPDPDYMETNIIRFRDEIVTVVITDILEGAVSKAEEELKEKQDER